MVVYTLEQRFAKWACDRLTKDAHFGKKKNHLFRWSSFWSWRVCKLAKLSHLGHRKPVRIHWKPKTSHCLVRILVQRHNWVISNWKWARRGRYSQCRSLTGHVERIFVQKNWREWYWQHLISTGRRYVPHSRSYTWCFAFCFWRLHYQPQSWCHLATWELQFASVGLLFCGVPSKISVTPTSQRQLTIFVKPLVKYSCTQSIMCLNNWTDRVPW